MFFFKRFVNRYRELNKGGKLIYDILILKKKHRFGCRLEVGIVVLKNRSSNMSKEFILGLIKKYRSFPCLWQTKSDDYTNRDLKASAYQKLLEYGKRYHKECTLDDIKRKIQNLRTTFRREYRKIEESKLKGKPHHTYLWYYKLLQFTLESELPQDDNDDFEETNKKYDIFNKTPSETSNNDNQEDGLDDELEDFIEMEQENSQDMQVFAAPISFSQPTIKKRKFAEKIEEAFFTEAGGRNIGEYEAVTISWTAKLRKLNDRQKILAENLINQVLMRGYFDELTRNTQLNESM